VGKVEEYRLEGSDMAARIHVAGKGRRLRIWTGICDVEELKEEITRRLAGRK
jgi:hypothetical protein